MPDPGRREREIETALAFVKRDIRERERSRRFPDYIAGMKRAVEMLEQRLGAERARTSNLRGWKMGAAGVPVPVDDQDCEAALKRIAEGPDTAVIKAQIAQQARRNT